MLELAATSAVPIKSHESARPSNERPAVSHIAVTTVASTIKAILGRVSRETSADIVAKSDSEAGAAAEKTRLVEGMLMQRPSWFGDRGDCLRPAHR